MTTEKLTWENNVWATFTEFEDVLPLSLDEESVIIFELLKIFGKKTCKYIIWKTGYTSRLKSRNFLKCPQFLCYKDKLWGEEKEEIWFRPPMKPFKREFCEAYLKAHPSKDGYAIFYAEDMSILKIVWDLVEHYTKYDPLTKTSNRYCGCLSLSSLCSVKLQDEVLTLCFDCESG
jgi:hypothetical protein